MERDSGDAPDPSAGTHGPLSRDLHTRCPELSTQEAGSLSLCVHSAELFLNLLPSRKTVRGKP